MRLVVILPTLLVTAFRAEPPVQEDPVDDLDQKLTREVGAELRRIDMLINDGTRYRSELKLLLERVNRVEGISDRVRRVLAQRIIKKIPPVCKLLALDSVVANGFPIRIWTDKEGKFSFEASFVQLNIDRTVRLKTADDMMLAVPLKQLSGVDLDYLVSLEPACDGCHSWVTYTSDSGEYVELSVGKDDGVSADGVWEIRRGPTRLNIRGREFLIWRNEKIGRVRIVRTRIDRSIARIIESSKDIRIGDIAVHAKR